MKARKKNWPATLMRAAPWLCCVAVGGLTAFILFHDGSIALVWVRELLSPVASLAAVFVGFAGTAMSILLAMPGTSSVVKSLKKQNGFSYIVAHVFDLALLGLINAALSVGGLALDWESLGSKLRALTAVWAGTGAGMFVAVALASLYLYQLLLAIADEP